MNQDLHAMLCKKETEAKCRENEQFIWFEEV